MSVKQADASDLRQRARGPVRIQRARPPPRDQPAITSGGPQPRSSRDSDRAEAGRHAPALAAVGAPESRSGRAAVDGPPYARSKARAAPASPCRREPGCAGPRPPHVVRCEPGARGPTGRPLLGDTSSARSPRTAGSARSRCRQSDRELGAGGWGKTVVHGGTHTLEQRAELGAWTVERSALPADSMRSSHYRLSLPTTSSWRKSSECSVPVLSVSEPRASRSRRGPWNQRD
jgi:hypothetical protein